jgi:5,10-methylenetetrahydrofolate reductase
MTMAPIAASHLLGDRGVETILQITGRDRNRLALQSELLAAHALGIENVLCMSGDPPGSGDHPDAKAVFDLDGVGLLGAASALQSGRDMAGSELNAAPSFFLGAVANPGGPDLDKELRRMEGKIEAGAAFFQTQGVYDPASFERFMASARGFDVPVLAGQIVLKSANMARNLNANLPGVHVPQKIIDELDGAESRQEKSVEISGRIIREIKDMCSGVHIMPIGWESRVPSILQAAGLVNGS